MTAIRVAVVEDQPLFRELLTTALDRHPAVEVVVSAGSVAETRELVERAANACDGPPIDCLIVDIELPDGNGVGLAVQLRRQYPMIGVIVLSSNDVLDVVDVLPEHQRRPWSYLHKASAVDLEKVIHVIWASLRGVPVIDRVLHGSVMAQDASPILRLSARQREILSLVADGLTNEGIADRLGITVSSVVNHIGAVYRRLELDDGTNPRVAATLTYLEYLGVLNWADRASTEA